MCSSVITAARLVQVNGAPRVSVIRPRISALPRSHTGDKREPVAGCELPKAPCAGADAEQAW